MKKFIKKALTVALSAALACSAAAALVACGGGDKEYSVSKAYTESNKSEIPTDMVNQVMFAYGEGDVDIKVGSKLKLD